MEAKDVKIKSWIYAEEIKILYGIKKKKYWNINSIRASKKKK